MRHRISWVAAASLALAAITGSFESEEARAATCTNAQLIPNVADLRVVQGAPLTLSGATPDRLARAKTTVVRAYLTNPTTCTLSNKQAIEPVSATLDVKIGGTSVGPLLNNRGTLAGRLSATQQVFSSADPYFVVPASYLTPASVDSFNVTFTLSLTYNRTGATSQTTLAGMTTAGATVDRKTAALRVLVVPMGDASSGTTQWSTTAYRTLQNVMTNTGRALPVPDGVTESLSSAAATGGIRYVVSGALLDVRALGLYKTHQGATKFCASATTWATAQTGATGDFAGKTLKGELQERLDNYNLYNTPPADVVLGVADGAITFKSNDGVTGGCDDGRAATPDPDAKTPAEVAWVRVDTGLYPTPLQMELFHTLGIVDPLVRLSFHSLSVEADGVAPNKGYNTMLEKIVALGSGAGLLGFNDHSIMNYDTTNVPYRADNTNVEPRDWMDALCNFGGSESAIGPFSACTISRGIGTDIGVGAGPQIDMYHITGRVSPDFKIVDANTAGGDGEFGIGDSDSPLQLCLSTARPCFDQSDKRIVPLARSANLPIDEQHTNETSATPVDTFSALISLQSPNSAATFTCAELRFNNETKLDSCASDAGPNILSTTVSTGGTVLRDIPMPGGNGRAVAFDGVNRLYTTIVGAATDADNEKIFKFMTDGTADGFVKSGIRLGALAYKPQDGHFYAGNYTGTGEIYHLDLNNLDESGNATRETLFTFNDETCAFTSFIDGLERLTPVDGNERLAVSGDRCRTVFIRQFNGETWTTPSSFTVPAGEDNSGLTTDGGSGLWLALHSSPSALKTRLVHSDLSGNIDRSITIDRFLEDLAFDDKTFAPKCAVWGNTADESPAHVLAIEVPCLGGSSSGGEVVEVTTENTDFVTVFAVYGNPNDPETEKFSLGTYGPNPQVPFSDFLLSEDAVIIAEASNGWTSTGLTDPEGTEDVDPPEQPPTVSISAPLDGSTFRIGDTIRYEGNATDAEDGTNLSLEWSDNKTPAIATGTASSFEHKVATNTPLGDHIITFKATDTDLRSSQVQITIRIAPRVCPSTFGCK